MRMYTNDISALNKRLWAVWSEVTHDVCFVSPFITNCRAYIRASGSGSQYAIVRFDISRFSLGGCLDYVSKKTKIEDEKR